VNELKIVNRFLVIGFSIWRKISVRIKPIGIP